ncbi:hypothetical protein L596_016127 [Steinernema carpocapsae]|uniref:Uncharacterized protein n=1 Tax=Steinernema carpocapsae TaxID=34508 RepID=A0A4U5NHW0_STECR|nr:hypothetical protein L596_016127 [Steinernema carpocapsae]
MAPYLLWLLLLFLTDSSYEFISCRSDCGRDVDWFVGTKLPLMNTKRFKLTGREFYYVDSNMNTEMTDWSKSPLNISDPNGPVGSTVGQIFSRKNDHSVFYLVFNDQMPNGTTSSYRGHTKGVMLFDENQGFLMMHSVPKFVDLDKPDFEYPYTGITNGQSFICITFNTTALKDIGTHLLYITPAIVKAQLPTSFGLKFLDLQKVIAGRPLGKGANTTFFRQIPSLAGRKFVFFGKHKKFNKDLYADLVAAKLQGNIYTQTWLKGNGDLKPSCAKDRQVYNIRELTFPSATFNSSKDHSKWVVTDTQKGKNASVVCVADINRQKSQFDRAGGAICLQHKGLWRLYRNLVGLSEKC